jgi:hypothetical protein
VDFHAATIERMARQLRIYTIKPGELETFSREWGEHILPLRLQSGFRVLGPWVIDETNQFVWILEHDGNFELADSRYYESLERKKMHPDPVRHIQKNEHWTIREPDAEH